MRVIQLCLILFSIQLAELLNVPSGSTDFLASITPEVTEEKILDEPKVVSLKAPPLAEQSDEVALTGSGEVSKVDSENTGGAEGISATYLTVKEKQKADKAAAGAAAKDVATSKPGAKKAVMGKTQDSSEVLVDAQPKIAAVEANSSANSSSVAPAFADDALPLGNPGKCPNNCSGHGECDPIEATCTCQAPYSGPDCSKIVCPKDCSGHGSCQKNGTCLCVAPFVGLDCAAAVCPGDCSKHGSCDKSTGLCECDMGFDGLDCANVACPKNCSGRGTCNNGTCMCMPGFKGVDCKLLECQHNCTNGGKCDEKTGSCVCVSPWSGDSCEEPGATCPNGCSRHGECNKLTGKCTCKPPFLLPDCAIAPCPKTSQGVCNLHGSCNGETGTCMCEPGFAGEACDDIACPQGKGNLTCSGHGECNPRLGRCTCEGQWSGMACEVIPCPMNCSGNGVCRADGKCRCDPQHDGPGCEKTKCPVGENGKECSEHGACDGRTGKCACDKKAGSDVFGFDGPACDLVVCKSDCMYQDERRGVCDPDTARCKCKSGFHGDDCSLADCSANCTGHGTCDKYTAVCTCTGGYSGPVCAQPPATPVPPPPAASPKPPPGPVKTVLLSAVARNSRELSVESVAGFLVGRALRINNGGGTEEENYITSVSPHDLTDTGSIQLVAGSKPASTLPEGRGTIFVRWALARSHLEQEEVLQLPEGYKAKGAPLAEAAPEAIIPKKADEPVFDVPSVAVVMLLSACTVTLVGGYAYNWMKGKRGVEAIPFYNQFLEE